MIGQEAESRRQRYQNFVQQITGNADASDYAILAAVKSRLERMFPRNAPVGEWTDQERKSIVCLPFAPDHSFSGLAHYAWHHCPLVGNFRRLCPLVRDLSINETQESGLLFFLSFRMLSWNWYCVSLMFLYSTSGPASQISGSTLQSK